jgi:hypothetical protein
MALPPPLRTSVSPQELELIASEQLVEIIPLVAMDRTAFISVTLRLTRIIYTLDDIPEKTGCFWSITSSNKMPCSIMDGRQVKTKEKMPHCRSRLVERR